MSVTAKVTAADNTTAFFVGTSCSIVIVNRPPVSLATSILQEIVHPVLRWFAKWQVLHMVNESRLFIYSVCAQPSYASGSTRCLYICRN